MKKIGKIGNVEISTGIMVGAMLVIDKNHRSIDFHLVFPFIAFAYTYYKPLKKNKYYEETSK